MIIGGLAAVAAMLLVNPDKPYTLLATSLVAGSAGIGIFRSIQDRIVSSLAQQQAAEARVASLEANKRIEQALALLETPTGGAGGGITLEALSGLSGEELAATETTITEVQRLLNEARGIHSLQSK
jgi:hypothetical protein